MSVDAWSVRVRKKGAKKRAWYRVGLNPKTGVFYRWGSPRARYLRRRGAWRGVIHRGDMPALKKWVDANGMRYRTKPAEATPHVTGKEAMVHPALLDSLESFMRKHAPSESVYILSGFRSWAKQMALWLAFRAGVGNPANYPGSSKHEASGGYKTARAVDAYVTGRAFWDWCDTWGLSDEAEAFGLRQPYAHEAWHVEKQGL